MILKYRFNSFRDGRQDHKQHVSPESKQHAPPGIDRGPINRVGGAVATGVLQHPT